MLQQKERFSTAENPTLWKTSTAHRINAKATLPRSRQCTNSKCHQAFGRFFPLTASSGYRIISCTCCPARHPHTRKAKRQRNATIYRTTSSACCPARRPHARKASAFDYIEHQHMEIISLSLSLAREGKSRTGRRDRRGLHLRSLRTPSGCSFPRQRATA